MDTWGTTPKSQTDNETINQAIDSAILAHEADPTAHLGEGEALQTHKSEDVIDHPAGSVLADKITMTELNEYWNYSHLKADAYKSGSISYSGASLIFYRSSSFLGEMRLHIISPLSYQNWDMPQDFLIDFLMKYRVISGTDNSSGFYGFIIDFDDGNGGEATKPGFGFETVNGVTKAVVKGYSDVGDINSYETLYESSAIAFTGNKVTHLRIQWSATLSTLYFYVDGSLVGQYVLDTNYVNNGTIGGTVGFYSPALTTTANIEYTLYQMNSVLSLI